MVEALVVTILVFGLFIGGYYTVVFSCLWYDDHIPDKFTTPILIVILFLLVWASAYWSDV